MKAIKKVAAVVLSFVLYFVARLGFVMVDVSEDWSILRAIGAALSLLIIWPTIFYWHDVFSTWFKVSKKPKIDWNALTIECGEKLIVLREKMDEMEQNGSVTAEMREKDRALTAEYIYLRSKSSLGND
jgi:hypothetical protein